MELLGDLDPMESYFGPFGNGVSVGARWCHGLRKTYHRLRKSFWTHPMVLLGYEAQLEAHFVPFRDSANLDARYVPCMC
jgi:hypothetical protein